jgi:hypothetical protein
MITGSAHGPQLDLHMDIPDHALRGGRMYLKLSMVHQLGEAVGMVQGHVHEHALERLAEALGRIEELEAEVDRAERFKASVDTIVSEGFRAREKRGRKPQKERDHAEVGS